MPQRTKGSHGVGPPVWIPGEGETAGLHRRSNARAISAGLTFRPLATTVADTLAARETLREARQMNLKAGLTRERDPTVLARLG